MRASLATAAGILASSLLTSGNALGQQPQRETAPPVEEQQLTAPGDYDVPPEPVRIKRPKYPKAAFSKRIEGTVVVEILIDTKGNVVRARVIQSVPALDAAAFECARKWRFKPAQKDGKPVATVAHAPIQFRIH